MKSLRKTSSRTRMEDEVKVPWIPGEDTPNLHAIGKSGYEHRKTFEQQALDIHGKWRWGGESVDTQHDHVGPGFTHTGRYRSGRRRNHKVPSTAVQGQTTCMVPLAEWIHPWVDRKRIRKVDEGKSRENREGIWWHFERSYFVTQGPPLGATNSERMPIRKGGSNSEENPKPTERRERLPSRLRNKLRNYTRTMKYKISRQSI